jgi:ABC-type glycerol-3-phosphate transport system substrate-binding protein
MHTRARIAVLSLVLTILAACGGEQAPEDKAAQAQAKAEAEAQGRDTDVTVFDDMIQTEDRARGVEDTVMASKAATDALIDAQSGDGSPEPQQ